MGTVALGCPAGRRPAAFLLNSARCPRPSNRRRRPADSASLVRLESIDLLRGAIMILMALDHTRDFFGTGGVNPTDPATTTIPLFFTRWITHFCAPRFFLLTGTGAFLSRAEIHASTLVVPVHARRLAYLSGTCRHPRSGMAVQFRLPRRSTDRVVGTGLGDDRTFRACLSPPGSGHDIWHCHDRHPQPFRQGAVE